jgi:hypothetical protein
MKLADIDGGSAHRKACIYIGKHKNWRTWADVCALSGFRIHDPSARAVDEITRPKLRDCALLIITVCFPRVMARPQVAGGVCSTAATVLHKQSRWGWISSLGVEQGPRLFLITRDIGFQREWYWWCALVNTAVTFWVPLQAGNLLASWATIKFFRRTRM